MHYPSAYKSKIIIIETRKVRNVYKKLNICTNLCLDFKQAFKLFNIRSSKKIKKKYTAYSFEAVKKHA